jgi:hypothetical protein
VRFQVITAESMKMTIFWMLRRVDWYKLTDVSELFTVPIIMAIARLHDAASRETSHLHTRILISTYCSLWLRTGRPGDRGSTPAGANDFYSNFCVQTGSGAHPASCTMDTGGPFPWAKRGRGVTLIAHPHLVPRSRMSRSYTSSPLKRHHGV